MILQETLRQLRNCATELCGGAWRGSLLDLGIDIGHLADRIEREGIEREGIEQPAAEPAQPLVEVGSRCKERSGDKRHGTVVALYQNPLGQSSALLDLGDMRVPLPCSCLSLLESPSLRPGDRLEIVEAKYKGEYGVVEPDGGVRLDIHPTRGCSHFSLRQLGGRRAVRIVHRTGG